MRALHQWWYKAEVKNLDLVPLRQRRLAKCWRPQRLVVRTAVALPLRAGRHLSRLPLWGRPAAAVTRINSAAIPAEQVRQLGTAAGLSAGLAAWDSCLSRGSKRRLPQPFGL